MSKPMNRLITVGFRKWYYNACGFNQLGLMKNDLINDQLHSDVAEALRRLPQEILDQRNFRIIRALQLSACHRVLPKEQWTKFEEDIEYLKPYLDEVEKENEEKARWEES
ncbi:PREDICTED: cytochrome b-c1 complex subunit 7-like [Acromyrmex echinatior]|nr:PREDICTED: cytochrome b-c1 complex subunit 7-like [Acromyrmex echinatior]